MDEAKLKKRKKVAISEGNDRLLISTCVKLSDLYMKRGEFRQAIEESKIVAKWYKSQGLQIEFASANKQIAEAFLGSNNFKKALEHQQIYLNIALKENDNIEIQRAYAGTGHIHLSTYLETQTEPEKNLDEAYKYFIKSKEVCEGLTSINKLEKLDMEARLLSNLGLVKQHLGDYKEAIKLYTTSINICKENDIYEQLNRGYISLASLYDKSGNSTQAIHNYDLAIEAAKKVDDEKDLLCGTLLTKSEALIKLGAFQEAKKSLYKAHKHNSPNIQERKIIKKYLKKVVTICCTADKLSKAKDSKEFKKLYEKMGDCACGVKNFSKGIEYYQLMLNYAEECGIGGNELAICYNSLAQTYEDNKMHNKAIEYFEKEFNLRNTIKDCLDALSKIADNTEFCRKPVNEVVQVYDRAIRYCQQNQNIKEERRMMLRCIEFLRRTDNENEVRKFEEKLEALEVPENEGYSSSSHYESDCSELDSDVILSNITDSDNSDIEQGPGNVNPAPPVKKVSKNFVVKKNYSGETQLHIACKSGKLAEVEKLIEQGHPINVRDYIGWLPIHEACNRGYYEIVKLLLDRGAAIDDQGGETCEGITPIFDAARNGHLEVVELLLDRGASVTIEDENGDVPLHAMKLRHEQCPFVDEEYYLYQRLVCKMEKALKQDDANQNSEDAEDDIFSESDELDKTTGESGRSSTISWKFEEVERLICLVKENNVLYNQSYPGYLNRDLTDSVWKQIASQLDKSVLSCTKKWRMLRACYGKRKRDYEGSSGSATKKLKKWTYYDQLTFLDPHLRLRQSSNTPNSVFFSPESIESTSRCSADFETLCSEEADSTKNIYSPSTSNQRRTSIQEKTDQPNRSGIEYFLLSLVDDVAALTPRNQNIFKMKSLLLIQELSES